MAHAINIHTTFGNGNKKCGNIKNSFNTTVNTIIHNSEDAEIMRWLSPVGPNTRHRGMRNDRFDGVGDWVLETGEFCEWRRSQGGADKGILFCSRNPGVGKTYSM